MKFLSTTLRGEIEKRIESAQSDVEGDGHDWDAVASDVIRAIASEYPRDVRREILRTELGVDLDEEERDDKAYWDRIEAIESLAECDECGSLIANLSSHEDDCPRVQRARERVDAIRREYGANRGDNR